MIQGATPGSVPDHAQEYKWSLNSPCATASSLHFSAPAFLRFRGGKSLRSQWTYALPPPTRATLPLSSEEHRAVGEGVVGCQAQVACREWWGCSEACGDLARAEETGSLVFKATKSYHRISPSPKQGLRGKVLAFTVAPRDPGEERTRIQHL
jgi:hypothetical protein